MESFSLREKHYLTPPSFQCLHGQILMDGRAGIFRIWEKKYFLASNRINMKRKSSLTPRKLSDPTPDQRKKTKTCKTVIPMKNKHWQCDRVSYYFLFWFNKRLIHYTKSTIYNSIWSFCRALIMKGQLVAYEEQNLFNIGFILYF